MLTDNSVYGKRIGLMGGTFDPIHYGHLMLAEQIKTNFHLDYVVFIPVGQAPHKSLIHSPDKFSRLEMVKLATHSNPNFFVSDIEVKKEETTYTIDTVIELKKTLNPEDELYFITGADAIMLLETWKNYESLIHMVTFIGATRPGIDTEALALKIKDLQSKYSAKIELCYIPALAISSTDIRDRCQKGSSIRYLLPSKVENYIHHHFLYIEHHADFFKLNQYLMETLTPHRYKHSIETAHLARRLALHYGVNPIKAEMAGLCHDIAKEFKNAKMLDYIEKHSIYKDACILNNPNLAHGEVGAIILKNQFEILDEEILDAIRWHTYGYPKMSLLSKIIYIADTIEPSRIFEGVNLLRKFAFEDMDQAILLYHEMSKQFISNDKCHSYTYEMIKYISDSRLES